MTKLDKVKKDISAIVDENKSEVNMIWVVIDSTLGSNKSKSLVSMYHHEEGAIYDTEVPNTPEVTDELFNFCIDIPISIDLVSE